MPMPTDDYRCVDLMVRVHFVDQNAPDVVVSSVVCVGCVGLRCRNHRARGR